MLEEVSAANMDKKPRQSSVPPKNGTSSDSKKNDNNSPNRFAKYGKKRESGGPRGGTPDYARRPTPQKSRTTGDKRPRSRGNCNDRQREEVADQEDPEYGSPLYTGGSKKANLNHLLNFTFAGRETNVGSSGAFRGGGRRPRTVGRVYNKERFLQANCQFVVGEGGDYAVHSIEADNLVDWDLVEQVRMMSHEPPSCPICLQEPQAGKITRCGHVYCWACILHYLELGDKKWRKCPICYDSIVKKDLKSVDVRVVHAYKPGEKITLRLMKRERGTTYSVPMSQWEKREGKPHRIDDAVNTEYVKILVASPSQIREIILEPERIALQKHMATAEDSEVCFVESAMFMLKDREENLSKQKDGKGGQPQNKLGTPNLLVKSSKQTRQCESTSSNKSEKSVSPRPENLDSPLTESPLPESPIPNLNPLAPSFTPVWTHDSSESEDRGSVSDLELPPPISTFPRSSSTQSDEGSATQDDSSIDEGHSSRPDDIFTSSEGDIVPEGVFSSEDTNSNPVEGPPQTEVTSWTPKEGKMFDVTSLPDDSTSSGARERSSLSESSVGSPDPHYSISEIQQSMEGAIPVDEAAEHLELPAETCRATGKRDNKPKSCFYYYQASDGQHIYLHAVNARCLVRQYGSLEECPDTITASIVDTESIFMTEELRKRLRYLNHLPLTCEFQVAELVLKPPLISKETLRFFADDIEKRRRMRQRKIREDKKRSKKIEEEENRKMGKFPEMRINISSSYQFPSYDMVGNTLQPIMASPDVRSDSPTVSSIASSPPISPSGATSAEIRDASDGEQTSMSFAQMLKAGKTKQAPVWPKPVESSVMESVKVARSADSEDSDNEDRVPVPMYQESFSCAIQAALDTRDKSKESRPSAGGKKKKQKQKFTKLFTTSMTRGK